MSTRGAGAGQGTGIRGWGRCVHNWPVQPSCCQRREEVRDQPVVRHSAVATRRRSTARRRVRGSDNGMAGCKHVGRKVSTEPSDEPCARRERRRRSHSRRRTRWRDARTAHCRGTEERSPRPRPSCHPAHGSRRSKQVAALVHELSSRRGPFRSTAVIVSDGGSPLTPPSHPCLHRRMPRQSLTCRRCVDLVRVAAALCCVAIR